MGEGVGGKAEVVVRKRDSSTGIYRGNTMGRGCSHMVLCVLLLHPLAETGASAP